MMALKIAESLARLRKDKKITQEELARFIGITKASVSKWENGQSMPDVLLLPQLAAYYGVSLDELFGYEPQLSKDQIRRIYLDFAAAFAKRPFGEVVQEVRETIRQYYACYPLLLQICVLYLNHCALAKDQQDIKTVLQDARDLCNHILESCTVVSINADATSLKALLDLQLGNIDAVIEVLEPMVDPTRFSRQDDATLIQAYFLAGKKQQAIDYAQVSMYVHLVSLVGAAVQYLLVNGSDETSCDETFRRVDNLCAAYKLERLHPNVMSQFHYQAALSLTAFGRHEEALERLKSFAKCARILLDENNVMLHADSYFTRMDHWFDELALGANPPRDKALIRQNALQGLSHPTFEPLRGRAEFEAIQYQLTKE